MNIVSTKCIYLGHCQFLPCNHSFRSLKKGFFFYNETNKKESPKTLTGEDIMKLVDDINYKNRMHKGSNRKHDDCDNYSSKLFKRKLISFLKYWQHLLVHHLLYVMHIERNLYDSIYGTLFHKSRKTKDGIKARKDLIEMKIKEKLVPSENDKGTIPAALYTLNREVKMKFHQTLLETKFSKGYSSNFRNLVSINDFQL